MHATASTDGVETASAAAARKATLLLLPGLDGTGILFGPLVPALGAAWNVVVQSYPQDPALGYDALTALVRRSLPDHDFFILGESFSGPIAVRIAAGRPPALRGVILSATFVRNPTPLLPAFLRFMIAAPFFSLWPVTFKLRFLTSFRMTEELGSLLDETRRATSNRVLAARTRAALGVDVAREFTACPYPLLYLCGARDIVVPRRNLSSMLRLRPDMEYHCLETSHMVLQEAPQEAALRIDAFMRDSLARNQALRTTVPAQERHR